VNIFMNRSRSTGVPSAGVGLAEGDASDGDDVPDATVGLDGLLESESSPPQAVAAVRTSGTRAAAAIRRTC
jgi:hypothetical protein